MLEIQARHGVHATYNVVGTLFREKHAAITAGGHAIGFHSYNHCIDEPGQLPRTREIDLQVRGYRPPQSVLTAELSDYNLTYFNFEWLLTSARSFGFDECRLENGIAKIPVHLDDHPLHTGAMDYASWRACLGRLVDTRDVVVVGLHDCYAPRWLDRYEELLAELRAKGEVVTCDALADRLFLASDWSRAV
jgi:peptidoglycan/xylan/chitin deacetylase (PgdA/CDA1 family)